MDMIDIKFFAMLDALGDSATQAQKENLISFVTENYPASEWIWCAQQACISGVDGVYTDLSMRAGESGY